MSQKLGARRPAVLCTALLLGAVAFAGPASGDDTDSVVAMRLADLEAQGRCAEAVEAYRERGKVDARMALVAGRCQVRGADYQGAIDTLTAVRDLPDAPADVDLQIAIAEYHQGDHDAARRSIERARSRGSEGAIVELYTGLLQLQADEARNAANSLERARRANAQAVEPVASYYAFLAWRSLDEEDRARAAFERLEETDPDGPWIAEARRILGEELPETPRFWANAEAGFEYDSNVVVKGGVPNIFINGETTARKRDFLGVWSVDGGTELFHTDHWAGGLIASYAGNAHLEIEEFDTHYPSGSAWLDWLAGERTTLRARYDYGYAWVNDDPYVSSHTATGTLFQGWKDFGLTELSLSAGWYDFKYDRRDPDDPTGPGITPVNPLDVKDIDRDGTDLSAEILQRWRTGLEDLEVHGGYRYTWYTSDGFEYDYMAHRFFTGFDVTLPLDLEWSGDLAFTYRPFDEVSAFQTPDVPGTRIGRDARHRDRLWEVGTELEKFVSENVSLVARYHYADAGSNTGEYDYHRHVVGAYVRVRFR